MISRSRRNLANSTLFLLALFYIIMLGGGNYEHLNVTHKVASAVPKSLAMMQGPYGFSPIKFWVIFRPITILLFLLAIGFNWKISVPRRKLLLIAFLVDTVTTIATFAYFAPETGVIVSAPFDAEKVDTGITARAQLWESLNLLRLAAFYGVAILLLLTVNRNLRTTD